MTFVLIDNGEARFGVDAGALQCVEAANNDKGLPAIGIHLRGKEGRLVVTFTTVARRDEAFAELLTAIQLASRLDS